MPRLLLLVFLLLGGLQVSQSFASVAAHACCPDAGLHSSCCLDAGLAPLASAASNGTSLWCGRTVCAAPLKSGLFRSRGESPLIRPPIP